MIRPGQATRDEPDGAIPSRDDDLCAGRQQREEVLLGVEIEHQVGFEHLAQAMLDLLRDGARRTAYQNHTRRRAFLHHDIGMKLRRRPRQTLDRRLFGAINRLPHTKYLDEQISLLSDLGKGVGWTAGGAWLALRDGSRGQRAAAASVGGLLAAVALVQGPVKASFPRNRPSFRHQKVAVVVGEQPLDTSFPSGHTAGSFAAAVALSSVYPKDRPLLLLLASAVGVSRVYLGHHFPSDVLVGAAAGAAVGMLASRLAHLRTPGEPAASD